VKEEGIVLGCIETVRETVDATDLVQDMTQPISCKTS
jgi:hypothetical protein